MRTHLPAIGQRLLLGAAVSGAIAMPAIAADAASAARIQLNAACYVTVGSKIAPVTITGSGFGPGDDVEILGSDTSANADSTVSADTTADSSGDIDVTTEGPLPPENPGVKQFTVTATDTNFDTGATFTTAPATGYYTEGGMTLSRDEAKFTTKLTYYFGGLRPGTGIYGHYFVGKKLVGTHSFGKAQPPCGTHTARTTVFPITGHGRPSKWTVRIDDSKKYDKHATPFFIYPFKKLTF